MLNMAVLSMRRALAATTLITIGIVGTGCSTPAPPIAELPPPEVTVAVPVVRELSDYLEFTGRTEAIESVEMRARVSGYLVAVNFEEGEDVSIEDVLFEIDPRPYEAALQAANAAVASAEAELKKAQADVNRDRLAFEKEAVSQMQLDTSVALEGIALAAVDAAKAEVETAKLDVEFTKVVAPVNGRVGRALITKGNLISAGQTDSTLTTVVSVSPIDVYFDIDGRSLNRIKRMVQEKDPELRAESVREANVPVDIRLEDEDEFLRHGQLDYVDNQLDPETGTIRVRARFANEDKFLLPGMFVHVRLPLSKPESRLLIPERAIGTDQGQRYVLIVKDDDSTERRDVVLGVRHSGGLRIVDSGISAGERVVVEGVQRVRPPAPVSPQDAPAPDVPDAEEVSPEATPEPQSEPESDSDTSIDSAS